MLARRSKSINICKFKSLIRIENRSISNLEGGWQLWCFIFSFFFLQKKHIPICKQALTDRWDANCETGEIKLPRSFFYVW